MDMRISSPYSLPLTPIPISRMESSGEEDLTTPDGFVDEQVISALILPVISSRHIALPVDLALSSDENDFAGWNVRRDSPFRELASPTSRVNVAMSSESGQDLSEPGIGKPHQGGHRWWIAVATGCSSALILSLLFSTLAERSSQPSSVDFRGGLLKNLQAWVGSLAP